MEALVPEHCPSRGMALLVVERALERSGVSAELEVEARSKAQERHRRFVASPSVLVDGVDVEPLAAERTDGSLGLRVFRCGRGIHGWPEETWIRSALLMAAAQGESGERSSATSPYRTPSTQRPSLQ